jgi:hypothetical protein
MNRFFARNIDGRGRIARTIFGALLVMARLWLLRGNRWAAWLLAGFGGFALFEALLGWCVMRACGCKTKW